MLSTERTLLVLVDVQGRLAELMHERESLYDNLERLVLGVRVLGLPIIWLEQNPRGLGSTIPELTRHLTDLQPIPKMSFSCCGCADFRAAIEAAGRDQVLLAGIETHVCIYQTTVDLLAQGYQVQVVADAVSSRSAANRHIGLTRAQAAGGALTSVEMALFEMLGKAEGPQFKEILKIVR